MRNHYAKLIPLFAQRGEGVLDLGAADISRFNASCPPTQLARISPVQRRFLFAAEKRSFTPFCI